MHKFMPIWMALAVSVSAVAAEIAVPHIGGVSAVPATAPGKAAQENPFIVNDAPMNMKPAISAEAVVRFTIVDGFLLTQTTMPASTPQMQIVSGLANPVHLGITDRGNATPAQSGYYSPDMLQVSYVSNEGSKWTRTSLFTAINHLNLSRDIITDGSEQTIQFIQTTQPAMAGKAVTLYLQALGPDGGDEKQSYSAETFAAFIRSHPVETTQYLRPMVEVLGPQPHLFVVDGGLACTVFPESFTADDARRSRVLDQVNLLNADDFRKRQEATQRLEQMGVTAAALLASLDRGTMPPEQAARVDAIISRIKPPFEINVSQLRSDPGFLLDCLLSPDEALRRAALAQLNKVTGRAISFDAGHEDASRIKAVYELRARLLVGTAPSTQSARAQ